MWTHPGKKLLFMGGEFGQRREWNDATQLDWSLLDDPGHASLLSLVRDLNHLYAREPALHQSDAHPDGFRWLIVDDRANSVFAFLRTGMGAAPIAVIANMTPVPRHRYIVRVPVAGDWREVLNTDATAYGGSNVGNYGGARATSHKSDRADATLSLTLPPLATIVLRFQSM